MHALYAWVSGPLVWIAFLVFVGGTIYRLSRLLGLVHRKERFIYSYFSVSHGLRSIAHWSLPFAATNMRRHPVLTIVAFLFHLCLLITPLFLSAHVILFDEAWSLSWWTLPNGLADLMTLVVIGGALFFLVRRLKLPEVRYVTSPSDFMILAVTVLPFLSGFMAYHQWLGYQFWIILHIVSGAVLLIVIPFSRLFHMFTAPLTRAYMGSEFGKIRHARDW
ncbi:MAG: nitrate reductase [Desulfobacterales bacterium]